MIGLALEVNYKSNEIASSSSSNIHFFVCDCLLLCYVLRDKNVCNYDLYEIEYIMLFEWM